MAKNIGYTLGDIFGNVLKGAMKTLEGIYDFGVGTVGTVGGLFSSDFKRETEAIIRQDWTKNNTRWLDEAQRYSHVNDWKYGDNVRNIAGGVGGMLPSVAVSFIPVAGPALSMGATMTGAAGSSTEEALNSGARLENAYAYGVGSGLIEGATEKIGGFAFGKTSKLGKSLVGTRAGGAISKGIGKVAFDAASEGAEEVLSDVANPALKYLTGVDRNIGQNYKDTLRGLPQTFLEGAAVGGFMQAGTTFGRNIKNTVTNQGGAKATRATDAMRNIEEITSLYGKDRDKNFRYDTAIKRNLTDVSAELVKMKPEQRKSFLERAGTFKSAFDEGTGKLKENLVADVNQRAISSKLRTISGALTHKPLKSNEEITKEAESIKETVERVLGKSATVAVTNELDVKDKALFSPRDGVIYINNKAKFTGEDKAKIVALHEIAHTTEGTGAYTSFIKTLEKVMEDKSAPQSIKDIIGDVSARTESIKSDYKEQIEGLGDKYSQGYLVQSELHADVAAELLGNDYFVDKLAQRDESLFKKIFDSFKSRANAKKSELGPDGVKYLNKLSSKFATAIDKRAGGVMLSSLGEEEESEAVGASLNPTINERFSFVKSLPDGRKLYRTNYKENTPKSVKQQDIINLAQNVWSKEPIELAIVENGSERKITAQFNPELNDRSDLSKIAFGNRKGTGSEKRITLNLASDLYQIASDSKYTKSKAETGKDNPAHQGVKNWHYFVTDLVYEENGKQIDCYMNIDIKENADGNWFYSFAIEKGVAPQTLLAVVTEKSATTPDNIISENDKKINTFDERKYKSSENEPEFEEAERLEIAEAARRESYAARLREFDEQYNADIKRTAEILDEIVMEAGKKTLPVANREYGKDNAAEQAIAERERTEDFEDIILKRVKELEELNRLEKESAEGFIKSFGESSAPVTYEFEDTGNNNSRAQQAEKLRKASQMDIHNTELEKYKAHVKNRQAEFESIVNGIREQIEVTYEFENSHSNAEMLREVQKESFDRLKQLASEGAETLKSQAEAHKESVQSILDTMTLEEAKRLGIEETDPKMLYNMGELAKMESILTVDPVKLEKTGKKPKEMFNEYFASLGGVIHSERFGDIGLTNSSARSEIRHGLTTEKLATIEAIPDVIQNGVVIFDRDKEAGVHRTVVCAPIKIGTHNYYMGVMLHKDPNTNRLYLHNVVSIEQKRKAIATPKADRVTNGALEGGVSTEADLVTTGTPADNDLSMTIILQNALKVKFAREKNMAYSSKTKVRELIEGAIATLDITDEEGKAFAFVTKDAKGDVVTEFWKAINSASGGTKKKVIDNLADKLLENMVFAERGKYETLDYLKSVMHKFDLSKVQDKLDADLKRKINARWGFKEGSGSEGATVDIKSVIAALNMQGFDIGYTDPMQGIIAINDVYDSMREYAEAETGERLKERLGEDDYKAKKKEFVSELKRIFEENKTENELAGKLAFVIEKSQDEKRKHREYKKEFKQDEKRIRAMGNLMYWINRVEGWKNYQYSSATQPHFEALMECAKLIVKMKHMGNLTTGTIRETVVKLNQIYKKENPLLEGYYDEGISELINDFAVIVESKQVKEKELSLSELRAFGKIVCHFSNIIEKFNKIFQNGKWVDAKEVAKEKYGIMLEAIKNKSIVANLLVNKPWYFMDPEAVALYLDGYDYNGFFYTTLSEFRNAVLNQKNAYMKVMKPYEDFEKKHKKLIKQIVNGTLTQKINVKIVIDENRQPQIKEQEIPLYAAMELYMSSQTGENIKTFEETGFILERDGVDTEESFGAITKEQIKKMYEGWSNEIKELISIIEETYNGEAQELKYNADLQNRGYSNIILNGKYYPTSRVKATKVDSMENFFGTRGVGEESYSFNKNRVKGAKNAIYIGNCLTKFKSHIMGITKYAFFTPAFKNFEKIYNVDTADNSNNPVSIKMLMTRDKMFFNPLSKNVNGSHQSAYDYFNDMIKDMCGMNATGDFGQRLADYLRGAYAAFVLGANPKTVMTQLSSYVAAFGELDFKSLVKALPKIAVDRVSDEIIDKYCPWAAIRQYEIGLTKAMSLREKVGKISKVFGAGMEWMDRKVVKLLFAACQYEVQEKQNYNIGTEKNYMAAGELLTQVGLRTQQNQLVTEKSAAARSKSELMKGAVAFKSDATKINSHFISSIAEITVNSKKIKDAQSINDEEAVKRYKKQRRKALNKLGKYSTVLVVSHAYMALIAMAFAKFYNQDEEETTFWSFIKDMFGSFCGSIPIIADVYAAFADGYEVNSMAYSSINSVVGTISKIKSLHRKYENGEKVEKDDWLKTVGQVIYSVGQVSGIPAKNINKVFKGVVNWFTGDNEQSGGAAIILPSKKDILEQLEKSIEENNIESQEASLEMLYMKYDLEITDKVLKGEMDRLIKLDASKDSEDESNYSPLGFKIPEKLEIDGEDVELSAEDRKVFKNVLKSAEKASAQLVRTLMYKRMSDDSKAYAIRKVYEYYTECAKETVSGSAERERIVYFGNEVPIDILANVMAYKRELNAASEESKAKRLKSTKQLVTEYLRQFNLSRIQKSLVLRALGYGDKENDAQVKAYISRKYDLTKEQKAEFLEYAKAG